MITILLSLIGLFSTLQAPPSVAPKPQGPPLASFVGQWTGTEDGQPGHGTTERTYQYVLAGKFLEVRNRTVIPPQDKNPKGEVHEDVGYFSYDRTRQKLVLRQFHIEGFVNQYVQTAAGPGDLVFQSEAIENVPAGWRARESYTFQGADQFTETFELAESGKDFEVYSRTRFTRKPAASPRED